MTMNINENPRDHSWMVDVLLDLKGFAEENALPMSVEAIDVTLRAVSHELLSTFSTHEVGDEASYEN